MTIIQTGFTALNNEIQDENNDRCYQSDDGVLQTLQFFDSVV